MAMSGQTLQAIANSVNLRKSSVHRILNSLVRPIDVRREIAKQEKQDKYFEKYGLTEKELQEYEKEFPELVPKLKRSLAWTKARAKRKNILFNLKLVHLLKQLTTHCPVLGVKYEVTGDYCPSIDRKIPEKGYTKGNILLMSWRANRIKYNSNIQELRALLNFLENL